MANEVMSFEVHKGTFESIPYQINLILDTRGIPPEKIIGTVDHGRTVEVLYIKEK